jgi:hypothetical protein
MPISYLKFVEDLTAGIKWFNGYYGRRFRGTAGLLANGLAELSRQAFLQRLPGHPEQARDSLDAVGHDRDLLFYPGETEAQWLDRVVNAWDSYGYSSTPQSVKVAVEAWGAATFPTWVAGNVELVEHNYYPPNDSSLRAWFDMQDATSYTVTGGTTVTSITNKKSGVPWNDSAVTFPLYEAAGINGKPCMRGNEASERGIYANENDVASIFQGDDSSFTAVALLYPATLTLDDGVWFSAADPTVDNARAYLAYNLLAAGNKFSNVRYDNTGAAESLTRSVNTVLTPQAVSATHIGTAANLTINNDSVADYSGTMNVGVSTPTRIGLFYSPQLNRRKYWPGRIGELLFFYEGFTAAKTEEVRLWLLARWLGPDTTGIDFTVYISSASCGWTNTPFTYGSGRIYGDGSVYGSNAQGKDISMLKKTINKYKRGASRGRVVIYGTHPGDTLFSFKIQ